MNGTRGRPVRGAISGLFTGLFLAVDLAYLGALKTDSVVLTILPIAGLVLGLVLGWWAPVGRVGAVAAPAPGASPAAAAVAADATADAPAVEPPL